MKKCLLKYFCFKEENITFRLNLSPFEFVNNKTTFLLENLNENYDFDKEKNETINYFVGPDLNRITYTIYCVFLFYFIYR